MAKLLYLTGPIDREGTPEFQMWRDQVHEAMIYEKDWIVYDPWRAFTVAWETEPSTQIGSINRMAMACASAFIAYLPDGVPTYGVPMEIQYAIDRDVPVAIVGGNDIELSWALANCMRLRRFDEAIAFVTGKAAVRSFEQPDMLKVQRMRKLARLPTRAHEGDAAWDLYCAENATIPPHGFVDVSIGIAIEPPAGTWTRIIGRSSTYRTHGLMVIEGTIDSGYRGELFVGILNMRDAPFHVNIGDRIAQLIPMVNLADRTHVVAVDHLSGSERGTAGFGSSGT